MELDDTTALDKVAELDDWVKLDDAVILDSTTELEIAFVLDDTRLLDEAKTLDDEALDTKVDELLLFETDDEFSGAEDVPELSRHALIIAAGFVGLLFEQEQRRIPAKTDTTINDTEEE